MAGYSVSAYVTAVAHHLFRRLSQPYNNLYALIYTNFFPFSVLSFLVSFVNSLSNFRPKMKRTFGGAEANAIFT